MGGTHRGLYDFHIVRGAALVLVHQFGPGFLDAVDAVVFSVDVQNGELVPLSQNIAAHFPGQGGK